MCPLLPAGPTALEADRSGGGSVCLLLPAGLTTRQRAAVHEVASAAGLAHTSSGIDSERRLAVGNPSAPRDDPVPLILIFIMFGML